MKRVVIIVSAIVLATLLFGQCRAYEATPGGTLRYGSSQILGDDLMPFVSDELELLRFHALIYESLVKRDASGDMKSWLAKEYSPAPDLTRIDFVMRDDVKWHDGKPLTADDVKFSFDLITHEKTISPYKGLFDFVESARIPRGQNTVIFSFKYPVRNADRYFEVLPILPSHLFLTLDPDRGGNYRLRVGNARLHNTPNRQSPGQNIHLNAVVQVLQEQNDWLNVQIVDLGNIGEKGWIPRYITDHLHPVNSPIRFTRARDLQNNLVGTGPFQFQGKDIGGGLDLKRNENYHMRPAYFDGVKRNTTVDPATLVNNLGAESLNFLYDVPFNKISEINAMENIRMEPLNSMNFSSIVLNMNNSFFQQASNRKALVKGFNRWVVFETFFRSIRDSDVARVLAGPSHPRAWNHNTNLEPLPFDPEKAENLIQRKPDRPLMLLVNAMDTDSSVYAICEAFKNYIKDIGIEIQIDRQERGAYRKKLSDGDFDLAYVSWALGASFDLEPIFSSGGFSNYGNYSNPQVDRLLSEINKETDDQAAIAKVDELQEVLRNDNPHIFLWSLAYMVAFNRTIQGVNQDTLDPVTIFNYVDNWWLQR
jgi:ABC-type transport system substrate-binding protein